jgi:oxalate decarboxylase/phosphoglucose isomerase-like protein (cupin superfamily)
MGGVDLMQQKRFVEPDEIETLVMDWGACKILCEPAVTGSQTMTITAAVLQPGCGHARHNHPNAEQFMYIVSGEGEQMVEDDDGTPVTRPISAGMAVYVPTAVYHSTYNTGWEPLRLITMYGPSGPESDLRKSANKVASVKASVS